MGNKLSQELCKKERETLSKMFNKKSKSPLYKKCEKINDPKKKMKCYDEQDKEYYKTNNGKKHLKIKKNLDECYAKEINSRGCLEKKKLYDDASKKSAKVYGKLFKLIEKMNKKCGKISDKNKQKKCGKEFDKELKYYYKSKEVKNLDKEYKKTQNSFQKCMQKS